MNLCAGLLIKTVHPHITYAGLQEISAVHARRKHLLRRKNEIQKPRIPRPPDDDLRRLLPRLRQKLYELLHIQPVELITIHRHKLIPRSNPGLGGRSPRQSLQHNHASRQHRYHAAKPFLRRRLEFSKLIKLPRIEKNRVWIQSPQHAWNRALKKNLLGGNRISGIIFGNRVSLGNALNAGFHIVRGAARYQPQQRCESRKLAEMVGHLGNFILACGNRE